MLNYTVYTEQEAIEERFSLLKEGEYDAVIISSQDRTSGGGNPMMDMMLQVFDDNGKRRDVRDFLVFTKTMMWRVIHFAESAGVMDKYLSGELCSEIVVGKRVRVKIGMEDGRLIPEDKLNGKPMGSKYPNKNKVEDYIKPGEQATSKKETARFPDDDLLF